MSDSRESSADTALPPATAPVRKGGRRLIVTLLALTVLVAAGSAFATWQMGRKQTDSTPLPRPWINAPFITTPMDVVEKMLEIAEVKDGEVLYDLGCGDGRIAVVAAEKYGCRSFGYDIDQDRIRDSRENAKNRGVEKLATFEKKDVFQVDLSQANVAAMYLLPRYMTRLIPQFQQMRPGSRIVAHDFAIEGVPPDQTLTYVSTEDGQTHYLHLWITPLKIPEKQP